MVSLYLGVSLYRVFSNGFGRPPIEMRYGRHAFFIVLVLSCRLTLPIEESHEPSYNHS